MILRSAGKVRFVIRKYVVCEDVFGLFDSETSVSDTKDVDSGGAGRRIGE